MSPDLKFRGQPFSGPDAAGHFLRTQLGDAEIESVTIVAAWARFGGLARLKTDIEGFRDRGGTFRILLGIDEGVASRPGLLLAVRLADQAFVFHDGSGRTFHPKVYLCEGGGAARLLVGSSNLTAGGLYSNYEASLEARFDLPRENDAAALVAARAWIEQLLADSSLCRTLDEEMVDRLCHNSRYSIAPGERRRPSALRSTSDPDLFGVSSIPKSGPPALTKDAADERAGLEEGGAPPPEPPSISPAAADTTPVASVDMVWSKALSPSDAQHPPNPASNPLGNVRLTKGNSTVNWRVWFREELFAAKEWEQRVDGNGNPIEVATVPFQVTIDGEDIGVVDLEVDHAPHRESGQDNHATVLHWGSLGQVLRETDYSRYTLTLERLAGGAYHLDISP